MSLNQTNRSLQSQFNFCRSTFIRYSAAEQFISLNKIIQFCSKNQIQLIQLPQKRLQSGLNIIPFKITSHNCQQHIIIFLTKYNQKYVNVTAYKNGKKIESLNAINEQEICKIIKKWIDSSKSVKEDLKIESQKIIQKLNKKCQEISKKQNNEMMAIQKLKSTAEYHALIELEIQLVMQIESLSLSQIEKEKKVQEQNPEIIEKVLTIQKLKNKIEENQYQYEEICKNIRNIKQMINQLMQKQQQKIQKMSVTNENELTDFLVQARKLKRLQFQKRFLH